MRLSRSLSLAGLGLLGLSLQSALAAEYPIGEPKLVSGMEIAAVYLQPIEMEPEGMMAPASETDIHLEADIHATAGNTNGFAEGDWLPNLAIDYRLTRIDDGQEVSGTLMTMVASDGPHYGDNVKLKGPGKYRLELVVNSSGEGHGHFGRHVDKETGVAPWPEPVTLSYEFAFTGTGKKGGY